MEAVCAVENVADFEWLTESNQPNVRTPDLRVTLQGGQVVTIEITMATIDAANRLLDAAEKMRPRRFRNLTHEWKVYVTDPDIKQRRRHRRLRDFVSAMATVFSSAEVRGGTPQDMKSRAEEMLDPDPYYRTGSRAWWIEPWALSEKEDFHDWVRSDMAQHCDYWYPPDIIDFYTDDSLPRWVYIISPPTPAKDQPGGIHVHASGGEAAYGESEVMDLVTALQNAIDKKTVRGQMAQVPGEKWLLVPLDGGNAAEQLAAFRPTARLPHPDLSIIRFSIFDEIWAIARTSDRQSYTVLRLSSLDTTPRFHSVPRPNPPIR